MPARRSPALLLAAPLLLLLGCNRNDPAANNAAEADNRAVADLLDVPDNGAPARQAEAGQPKKAPPPRKAETPASEPARPPDRHARRAGERG